MHQLPKSLMAAKWQPPINASIQFVQVVNLGYSMQYRLKIAAIERWHIIIIECVSNSLCSSSHWATACPHLISCGRGELIVTLNMAWPLVARGGGGQSSIVLAHKCHLGIV